MPEHQSSPPRPSLQVERDQFLGTFFKKGAKLTREILEENSRLRARISGLELENEAMKLQVRSNDAIRELLVKVQELEDEKQLVLSKLEEVRQRSTRVEETRQEVEEELTNLASLYVASRQLHASVAVDEVLQRISEILEQLIGAHSYALYMRQDSGSALQCVLDRNAKDLVLDGYYDEIREVMLTGTSMITEEKQSSSEDSAGLLACIPLRMGDRSVGVLLILSMLDQKSTFVPIDYELFELLRSQAAHSLIAAKLTADNGTRLPSFSRPVLSDRPPIRDS